jgi:hypothetical protein
MLEHEGFHSVAVATERVIFFNEAEIAFRNQKPASYAIAGTIIASLFGFRSMI